MKKIVRIFPIFVIVILNIFIILTKDMKEKELYKNIQSYNTIGFTIPENTENIKNEQIEQVFKSAIANDVILVKTVYNESSDSVDNYIVTKDVIDLLSQQLDLNKNSIDSKEAKFVATYKVKDSNSYYVSDFLNNDRYSFYPFEEMNDKHIYKYGSYTLYYKNETNLRDFFDDAADIFNAPKDILYNEYWGQLSEHTDIMYTGMFISITFFILFYFILILFLFYRETKKIGILLLLGYTKKSILTVTNKKYLIVLINVSLLFCLGSIIVLPNANLELFIYLGIMDVFMICLTLAVSYIALLFICKYTDLSNILKKQSIVQKVGNICLIVKFIMVIGMILFSINMFPLVTEAINSKEIVKESEILLDYAVFPRIKVENEEYDDHEKYLNFYKEINEKNIDHIYVRFDEYLETDKEIVNNYESLEKNGQTFRTASVDLNYLNLYNLKCFDDENELVELKSINQEVYLLPQSKKDYVNAFKKRIEEKYNHYNLNIPVLIFYYQDQIFKTYDSVKGVPIVESPIIRVVHEDNPFTYMEKAFGLDVAGTGMNTALKFNISSYENFYQSKLLECVKNSGLENVLTEDNFVTYKDYYSDVIANAKNINQIFWGISLVALLIYVTLVIQTFSLFIEAHKNKILVKSIIGFSRKDIFSHIIGWNIGATILPISGLFAYSITANTSNMNIVITISAIFILLDLFLLLLIARVINLDNVYSQIKGE